ncbi:MAG: acyl carrier protein [Geminicoccaceae bacterium]
MNEDTVKQVIAVLKKFDKTDKEIDVSTDIAAELDLDSLAVMDVIMDLEESLDISIPLNLIPDIRTVGDLAETIGQLKEEV